MIVHHGKPADGDRRTFLRNVPFVPSDPRSLFEPILESQPRHFLEISPIGREKKGIIGHRDAGRLKIHGTDFDARFAEAVEKVHRVGTQ